MPSHPDRVRENYKDKLVCPICKSDKITKIYRPEVYEYNYLCRDCRGGFNNPEQK